MVHIRHRQGMPGVTISAVDVESSAPRWETTLAAPLAAAPIADGQGGPLAAVSSTGAVFQLPASAFAGDGLIDQPVAALATAEMKEPIAAALPIGKGMIAMVPAGDPLDIHVFQPGGGAGGSARFRRILLTDPLSGPAAAFAGGVLAPCSSGQVCLMSPLTGAKMAEPFQPPLGPGQTFRWSAPVLVGDAEFLIANDRGGVYRVAVKDQPARHLRRPPRRRLPIRLSRRSRFWATRPMRSTPPIPCWRSRFPGWPRSRRAPWGPSAFTVRWPPAKC